MNALVVMSLLLSELPPDEVIGARYVLADVLRLRGAPTVEAPAVAKVRINTRLYLMEERGEWARVRLDEAEGPEGWVLVAMLREAPLELEDLRERAAKATGEEQITWAERVVALDGGQRGHWQALEKAYAAAGRKDKVRWVKQVLGGRAPGLLARCINDRVVLLAHFDADGKLGFGSDVEGLPWYAIGDGAPQILESGVHQRLTTVESENGGEALSVLGSCEGEGFFATVPLRIVSPRASDDRVKALAQAHPRRKTLDSDGSLVETNEVYLAPAFGGRLLLRVADWSYSWSHCEEGDNCGSEESSGVVVGGAAGAGDAHGKEILLSFGGC